MTRAGLVILVVVAALLGAPSRAFAVQNSLLGGQVTPRSGTAVTIFTFTVSYDGRFATTGVRTEVAGLSIPLARVSGTSFDGTWSTASVLPPGTWQVTFRATTTQGNAPTLAGGTVTVAGGATSPPTSGGPSPEIIPGPGPTPPSSEAPAPVATPSPSAGGTAAPVEPGATVAPPSGTVSGSPGATSGPGAGPGAGSGSGGGSAGAPAEESAIPSPGSGGVVEPGADPDRGPSTIGRAGSGVPDFAAAASDGLLVVVLVVGLSGVAAVAVIGAAFLLVSRRRGRVASLPGGSPPTAASDAVDAALERRTLRRARMRLDDDPIVAAMGLGDGDRRPPRRRAGQTGAGPGERPRKGV